MHTCIICIGSNYNSEENLLLAQRQLTALFPSICFADAEETKPFLFHNPALFTNQVARFDTEANIEEVKVQLKSIEYLAGRCPEDKAKEKVVLDIDLLMYDETVLKPKDMERDYVKRGLTLVLSKGEGEGR